MKRFLHIKRCFENLSSGEKRAGCAEMVGLLSGVSFCEVQSLNDERVGREARLCELPLDRRLRRFAEAGRTEAGGLPRGPLA